MIRSLTDVAAEVDSASVFQIEALRSVQLVRIFFSGAHMAELFVMRLVELGIEPERWSLLFGPGGTTELQLPF